MILEFNCDSMNPLMLPLSEQKSKTNIQDSMFSKISKKHLDSIFSFFFDTKKVQKVISKNLILFFKHFRLNKITRAVLQDFLRFCTSEREVYNGMHFNTISTARARLNERQRYHTTLLDLKTNPRQIQTQL